MRGTHDQGWIDRGKNKEKKPYHMNHETYIYNEKKFRRQTDTDRKAVATKRNICYICIGPMSMTNSLN